MGIVIVAILIYVAIRFTRYMNGASELTRMRKLYEQEHQRRYKRRAPLPREVAAPPQLEARKKLTIDPSYKWGKDQ